MAMAIFLQAIGEEIKKCDLREYRMCMRGGKKSLGVIVHCI